MRWQVLYFAIIIIIILINDRVSRKKNLQIQIAWQKSDDEPIHSLLNLLNY